MKPNPVLIATDFVLFGIEGDGTFILLIQRLNPPFKDSWALPGGFLDPGEDLATCALRELAEETSVQLDKAQQLGIYDAPNRDPRGRVISVVYSAVITKKSINPKASDDAKNLCWQPLNNLPELAFDHQQIIEDARARMLQ
jgi:8-oxo-dGTP diphosphatase